MGLFGSSPRRRDNTCPECGNLFAEKHEDNRYNDNYYCDWECMVEAYSEGERQEVNLLVNQGMTIDDAWAELNRRSIEKSRKRYG